ncbi:MAG: DoxX family protein [Flavobacteriales bacterium]
MSKLLNSEPVALDFGLLLLRVVAGGSMIYGHGWGKLMHFSDKMDSFGDPIGLGSTLSLILVVFAEVVCALLVMLGLWLRVSTVPLVITMGVAVFITHAGDPFGDRETAMFYLAAFTALFCTGSGRFAIDRISFS